MTEKNSITDTEILPEEDNFVTVLSTAFDNPVIKSLLTATQACRTSENTVLDLTYNHLHWIKNMALYQRFSTDG